MINLLPHDFKTRLHYGRLNIRLIRWLLVGLAMIAGLILLMGAGWLYMSRQTGDLQQSIDATKKQLAAQNLEQVTKKADEISQNVRIINQVLQREIRFSSLIDEIGKVMPSGTILNSLTLSEQVSGGIDLSAAAKNTDAAAQVAINLSDPKNNLFAKADLVSINCAGRTGAYPCTVELRALFNEKTAERFINAAYEGER